MSNTLVDANARKEAINVQKSFIVQAPAGSGKTELLTQRILALLATVNKAPEQILAITFTRKAAAEMRERVISALQKAANEPEPVEGHHRTTWQLAKNVLDRDQKEHWGLIDQPNRLRILTIDGLCSRIARQSPALSRMGGNPVIIDDPSPIYRAAAQNLLLSVGDDAPWTTSLKKLLLHVDNHVGWLETLFARMLSRRDQWMSYVVASDCHHPKARHSRESGNLTQMTLRRQLESTLQAIIKESLHDCTTTLPDELMTELVILCNFAAKNLNFDIAFDSIPEAEIDDLPLWQFIASILLKSKGGWRKKMTKTTGFPAASSEKEKVDKDFLKDMKNRMHALLETLGDYTAFRLALEEVLYLPPAQYSNQQWEIVSCLIDVLPILVAHLHVEFQVHNAVDYIEVSAAALNALGSEENPSDLALNWDYKIEHILVDEFQDTALTQFRLIEKLMLGWEPNDGRTLFLVGDPMQSIYRFREAEVGLFLRARHQGIGPTTLKYLQLQTNFRSEPGIVDWVNDSFAKIFPENEDIALGSVPYSISTSPFDLPLTRPTADLSRKGRGKNMLTSSLVEKVATQGRDEYKLTSPLVGEVERAERVRVRGNKNIIPHFLINADQQDEAHAIVNLIKNEQSTNPNQKIAILVRSRTHLDEIIPLLQSSGIRFQANEIERLAHRMVIRDLISLTKALWHMGDRLTWLAILRAPWCGLLLKDLLIIASDHEAVIFNRLQNFKNLNGLSDDAVKRLEIILPVLNSGLKIIRRVPLHICIRSVWEALNGPACIDDKSDIENAERFFELLQNVEEAGDLTQITELERKVGTLFATPDPLADDRLQIMSIHKAKGLEFDTVIIPGMNKRSGMEQSKLMTWLERPRETGQADLILAPIKHAAEDFDPIYQYCHRVDAKKAELEAVRLLYVAATRAKNALYLFGCLETDEEEAVLPPKKKSFLHYLRPTLEYDYGEHLRSEGDSGSSRKMLPHHPTSGMTRLDFSSPTFEREDTVAPPTSSSRTFGRVNTSQNLIRDLHDSAPTNTNTTIGTLIHEILYEISIKGLENYPLEKVEALKPFWRVRLSELGLQVSEIDKATDKVETAIKNTLNDERGRWILSDHKEAQSEYPITTIVNDEVVHLILDRTFVDENNVRWIIDYKTGKPDQESHHNQLKHYAEALSKIEKRVIKCSLYYPLMFKELVF